MRRSAKVVAPLLASVALSLTTSGCRKPEMQRCVDEANRVVDDSLCANLPPANNQQQNLGGGGFIPYYPLYHFYYGGWGGYGIGTVVGGGSNTPAMGRSYATRSGVTTRGGFGRSMSGGSFGHGGAGE
jgi:hypothetical protein